jgi:hypothetical protein
MSLQLGQDIKHESRSEGVGGITTAGGKLVPADHKVEGGPSVLFDAVAIMPSCEGGAKLATQAEAVNSSAMRSGISRSSLIRPRPPLYERLEMAEAGGAELQEERCSCFSRLHSL